MGKHQFSSDRIINIDETGVTTVMQAPKVVAPTGVNQIGQTVSAERGELVTMCGIVSASGNTIPPAYIFPRIKYKDSFLAGGPIGSFGFSSRSGWMTQEVFLDVMKHIQKYMSTTKENPILVLMDNHESHVSLDLIVFCREHGIVLLTFPPHTSHRLQPLDVAVLAASKNACKSAFNLWISQNPGKCITIYNIASLTSKPYDEAFCRKNILSGFKKVAHSPWIEQSLKKRTFSVLSPRINLYQLPLTIHHLLLPMMNRMTFLGVHLKVRILFYHQILGIFQVTT